MKKQQKQQLGVAKAVKQPKQQFVAAAAAYAVRGQSSKPLNKMSSSGDRLIVFREFVQDIAGSVAFSANSFPVQPGIPTLFAWLATQALSYQEYRFRKLRFVYETEKSSATSGKVMFAFLPDASDSVPTSKQDMLENQLKLTAPVWDPQCVMDVGPDKLRALSEVKYIRFGNLAANLDIKTYDVGQLIVATQGCADTSAIGELYVEYEVELMTPIIDSVAFSNAFSATFTGATPSQTSVLGTTPAVSGGLAVTGTVNTLTFNRVGKYAVSCSITGTGLTTSFFPVTSASTATVGSFSGVSNAAANAGTSAVCVGSVTVTARGQTLVLDFSTRATTITASSIVLGTSN